MPDFENILNLDSSRLTIDIAAEQTGENPQYFNEIFNIALQKEYPLNVRAVRVIEICTKNKPELIVNYADTLAKIFLETKNSAFKRIIPKILTFTVNKISEQNKTQIIDKCFKYLLSGKEANAVRVNCMQLLFDLSDIYPEIIGELQAAVEFIFNESPVSIKARARKILKEING